MCSMYQYHLFFTFTEILTTPPGCKEGVTFDTDGMTVLNHPNQEEMKKVESKEGIDIQIKINLEEIVDNNAHLVGKYMVFSFSYHMDS